MARVDPLPPYQAQFVSLDFRTRIEQLLPALAQLKSRTKAQRDFQKSAWRFVDALLFSAKRDRDTGGILIGQSHVAQIEGKKTVDGNYRAIDFLRQMQEVLPGLTWSEHEWSPSETRVRHVTATGLPDEAEQLARAELGRNLDPLALVDFVTGKPVTPGRLRAVAKAHGEQAETKAQHADHPGAVELLAYMNGLHPQPFTDAVKNNLGDAYDVALSIADPVRRRYALNLLRSISVQPKPYYAPSRRQKTPRIFGTGMARLPREVRATMTRDWDWFDLSSAQLAIAASEWGVTEVSSYLRITPKGIGEDIWASLVDHMGERAQLIRQQGGEDYEALKGVLKANLYGVVYGQARAGLARFATQAETRSGVTPRADRIQNLLGEPVATLGERFVGHPVVHALLRARGEVMRRVREEGGLADAFGVWIPASTSGEVRSALAQAAQASEMKLLIPVIELAKRKRILHVTLWLHDGFAVKIIDRNERTSVRDKIQRVVSEQARRQGVRTYAKVEQSTTSGERTAEQKAKLRAALQELADAHEAGEVSPDQWAKRYKAIQEGGGTEDY
jgi:hypothetical protein